MSSTTAHAKPRPAGRRDVILDEAVALVGNCGYRGLSFKDLAQRCGLTKQGVLHYFPSKEDLLLRLLDERDASIEAGLLAHLEASGFEPGLATRENLTALRRALALVIMDMSRSPDLVRLHVVLRGEAISLEHPANAYFRARDRSTIDWLCERLAVFMPAPTSKARQLLATLVGLQAQWVQEDLGFNLSKEWETALSSVLQVK